MAKSRILIQVRKGVSEAQLIQALGAIDAKLIYWAERIPSGLFEIPSEKQEELMEQIRKIPEVRICEPQIQHFPASEPLL